MLFTTVHVYCVPAGTISLPPLVGAIVKAFPEQIVCVLLAISGLGLTVAVKVKVEPTHVPEVGVTVYTTC